MPAPEPAPVESGALPPPPSVASSAAPEPTAAKADGPAAAARAALAQKLGRPAPPIEPVTTPLEPEPPPPPPVVAVPDAPEAQDLAAPAPLLSLHPESPREVVGLAEEHLGVGKDIVVARANELLGPASGSRSAEELGQLWQSLVQEFGDTATMPAPPPIAAVPDLPPEPGLASVPEPSIDLAPPLEEPPTDDMAPEAIDLDDLVDAPAHTEQIIEKVTEAFPGAELHIPEEPVE